ncbi:phosphatidylinositol transfer protein [Galdieria sulphuraria]|uniref:Phosphatidylinositol transfer protein n=1 Tax=Galdieria sulphuraria TaxID=130081 RepID=M2Y0C3_GALSU|nr:phosphatidylinositol transfer protein [Galdieria sulphuraria]EME29343.1 phosphatidylinositol transfer protein [Galdieria sulphuraria]|eukprot:XP_005705863.1 phosphatidylinositol transfer protein [Galdieria sulphuraria]
MLIKEYRLLMPLRVEEYFIAQLYMVAKASTEETGRKAGEGIEIVKNEPYEENDQGMPPGQYTEKIFHLKSRLPKFVRMFLPEEAMKIYEYSWNAYPRCKTVYRNPWLGDIFSLVVDSLHVQDKGTMDNALGLTEAELSKRKVEFLNIASDEVKAVKGEDPTKFHSEKTGRGPLAPDWYEHTEPVMCCYKVCKLQFKKWGLQTKVEQWGQYYGLRNTFMKYHRKLFCWIDEWYGLTVEDIRRMEDETQKLTREKLEKSKLMASSNDSESFEEEYE